MSRPHPFALLVPESWRRAHRAFADILGYFWTPCPLCGREFGGHEWRDTNGMIAATPKPDGTGDTAICPTCTRAGRGQRLPYITFTEGE
ncbi:hypothetical protein ACBJ59_10775 [Nonomuraea sp. MTCD27]|uniref:hypothetical protein n=1 Tax=Nonomuraea sp. MTCD27 TaxID=1676747 RepID=UPI0035BFD41F